MRLRSQLEEYKLLKEASEQLKTLENVDRFYKEPVDFKPEYVYKLDNLSMDALAQAFARIMHRMQANAVAIKEKQIQMDRFTVKDKIRDIRSRIKSSSEIMFFDLFEADFTKSEMINTFLALLELLKSQEIKAMQQSKFADIKIVAGEKNETNESDEANLGGENEYNT
jgi:segregation and condensation protein A